MQNILIYPDMYKNMAKNWLNVQQNIQINSIDLLIKI